MKQIKSRKLKIYKKYRDGASGTVVIPEIRLQGNWLAQLGFEQGKIVTVVLSENKLVISVDEAQ